MREESTIDPIHQNYSTDRGDETQRNFRYQHAYGTILLVAGACNKKPYTHLWCEHHEDLLAQRDDKRFDAFQIKTSQPELGFWNITDEDIQKSFKRFVQLRKKFGDKIQKFHFVSNTKCFDCGSDVKDDTLKKSPIKLLENIKRVRQPNELPAPLKAVFDKLCVYCECTDIQLFDTLKLTKLVLGPPREGFDTEISNNHLTQLDDCKLLPMSSLNQIRDEIIHKVYDASSLKIEGPDRYLYDSDNQDINPIILSKLVSIDTVHACIRNFKDLPFRYQPHNLNLKIQYSEKVEYDILTKKFLAGHLNDQITTMKRRTISAENKLLELAAIDPGGNKQRLNQLESVVQAECDEALFEVQILNGLDIDKPYGQMMLHNISTRLKGIVAQRPNMIFNEPYEVLMGVVGLLTESCSVWWSKKFDIKDSL